MTTLPELLEFGDPRLPQHTADLPFEIRHISPATGFGVFAKVDIPEGTSLFVETPLVNFPLFTFPEPILKKSVCSFCRKYLKSLEYQINLFVAIEVKSLPNIDSQESYLSDFETCSNNCGELYCSQKCKERDWEFSHKLLCPKECAGWEDFYAHSLKTENYVNFVMGARLVAHIILSSQNDAEMVKKSIDAFLKYFFHKEWRETVLISASDAVETRLGDTLDEEIVTSFGLLKKLFETYTKEEIYVPLFNMEFYSKILGAFNLNNICIEIESPLSQYVLQIHNLPKKFKTKALRSLAPVVAEVAERKRTYELSNGIKKEEDDEDEEFEFDDEQTIEWTYRDTPDSELKKVKFSSKLFPDFEGSGLYPLISKFNHNCAPNVSMEFADSSTAFAIASRDIRAGEEMCISYVDLRMDFEDRRKELGEYFFTCKCGVCELEERQTD
eukprot:Phypoly_transcript_08996.p1 GENE.Phypoly_transcript_08996~~Phypoly_transcript_08996.p1  ORF type:complete len:442 (+),score=79.68 Phypoly_transcript_08996:114-1439(+)